jgi:hypothetical protein
MSRLKHPIRAIREPFGTAGLIVAMIALVAALGGTALAASKLNSTQKKEVEKIAKKFAGKPGAPGTAGTNGINGTAGAGGKNGENGAPGSPGAAGKSVVLGTATAGECPGSNPTGGKTVEVEGSGVKKAVCNGKEGSPWTAGGTLPSGKTEKGTWAVDGAPGAESLRASISFTIPLAEPVVADYVAAPTPGSCPGTAKAPTAEPGFLCVYEQFVGELNLGGVVNPETNEPGGGKFGAFVGFFSESALPGIAYGSWAVTAE